MALKLVNVLGVTLLSKVSDDYFHGLLLTCRQDNCIFRSKPRAAINVVRQSTLVSTGHICQTYNLRSAS